MWRASLKGRSRGVELVYKVVWFARFPQGMAKEDARRYWAENHGPLCASTDIERYVQNHVIGPVPAVSGVPEEGVAGHDHVVVLTHKLWLKIQMPVSTEAFSTSHFHLVQPLAWHRRYRAI